MASNKKIERALNGPGFFEISFGVILSLALGVLLAALHLIFKPVEVVAKPPETAVSGQVYLVEGSANSSKSRQWMRKRQMLADGAAADVSFTEEELNAWMASMAPQPPKGAAAETPETLFAPEKVNFRIQNGILQVGLVGKVSVSALGLSRDMVFQTRGKFVKGDNGYVFAADELYLGSLPTHTVPHLTELIMERVLAAQQLPEDLKATWKKLNLVAVEDNTLRLVLP
jgi:hypothetical protein